MLLRTTKLFVISAFSLCALQTYANVQAPNAKASFSQRALSNTGNPAAAALVVERNDPFAVIGGSISIDAGLEYGNVDELFRTIDELRNDFVPPVDNGDQPNTPSEPSIPGNENDWDDFFNQHPDLEDRLNLLKDQVVETSALLALIATEGYAKAEVKGEAAFILNKDLYGGTLLFGTAFKGNAKAVGIAEEINFDRQQAKSQLERLPSFDVNDPIQALDLSAGITLFYDPSNQNIKLAFDNDSLLLVKSSKISEFSLSYSRQWQHFEHGDLYWGVKPIFYRVGLTNVSARLGDINDSEAIFDDIRNADYVYENGFDLDLGLSWSADYYALGASFKNALEHKYEFPTLDLQGIDSDKILSELSAHKNFTMQRQVTLEASIFTLDRHWSLNAELDTNAVYDPMRDRYQWLTVTGDYASESWWLPSARIGFSRNLAGTKLAYLNAGVTIFKYLNIDVATTLDSVALDGQDIQRGLSVTAGVQFAY